jgi:hypothetical protein
MALTFRRTITPFLATIVVLLIASPAADATNPPQLDILAPDKIGVSSDKSSDTSDVVLRNTGTRAAHVSVKVDAPKNAPSVVPSAVTVGPLTVKRFTLTFTPAARGKAATGALVASAPGAVPASIEFTSSWGDPGDLRRHPRAVHRLQRDRALPARAALDVLPARGHATASPISTPVSR